MGGGREYERLTITLGEKKIVPGDSCVRRRVRNARGKKGRKGNAPP